MSVENTHSDSCSFVITSFYRLTSLNLIGSEFSSISDAECSVLPVFFCKIATQVFSLVVGGISNSILGVQKLSAVHTFLIVSCTVKFHFWHFDLNKSFINLTHHTPQAITRTKTTTTTMLSTTKDARDQLEAMVRKQDKYYQCVDYLQVDEPEPMRSPLHVVFECALLVTDVTTNKKDQQSTPTKSPIKATNISSPSSSMIDLYSVSQSSSSTQLSNHSNDSCPSRPATELSYLGPWRHQMLNWAYAATETFNIDREVVPVAFSILDRYVSMEMKSEDGCPIRREDFQLFSMVSMYIAIKTLIPFRKLTVDTMIDMSRDFYTEEDITLAELDILKALDWHVNPTTVIDFCRLYMRLFPSRQQELSCGGVEAMCQYLAELALDDVYFLSKPASLVALATTLIAIQRSGTTTPNETQGFLANLRGLVNIQSSEFDSILRRLECLC
jgi:hypothetical protein